MSLPHIDPLFGFSDRVGSPSRLKPRDYHDPDAVLVAIRGGDVRRVSTFDMTDTLYRSLQVLEERGCLRFKDEGYPWTSFELTERTEASDG